MMSANKASDESKMDVAQLLLLLCTYNYRYRFLPRHWIRVLRIVGPAL